MTMPPRLTVVGEMQRRDHYHLTPDCLCYFWGEYTPYEQTNGLKWNFSATNTLISNLKKKMDRRNASDWRYKLAAIEGVADQFSAFWLWQQLHAQHRVALIPIPPSKARNDPMYDPRMLQVLQAIAARTGLPLDIRDCFSFSGSFAASHESNARPSLDDLQQDLILDPTAGRLDVRPGAIFLFDDMLTSGAHYEAVRRKLTGIFPGVPVVGNFVARRILPNPFADFDVLLD